MATKYADFDLATGNNDGSDWTNAWKTMADAIAGSNSAPPAAGDTVLCRGTDTLAGGQTNALVGSAASGYIKWIGVNAAGANDGTRATLDANGGNFVPLLVNGNYNYYENFRFTGSGNSNGLGGSGSYPLFVNCSFDTNNQYGFRSYDGAYWTFIRCVSYGNGNGGLCNASTTLLLSCIRDNTTDGLYYGFACIYGCVFYDNGGLGIKDIYTGQILNCVFDGNVSKGVVIYNLQNYPTIFIGNRVTNQSGAGDVGVDVQSKILFYGWNAFDGNTDHIANNGNSLIAITHNGTATNSELNENGAGGGDTLQGYVSVTDGSEDYSTNYVSGTDPHLRRTAITIPTS